MHVFLHLLILLSHVAIVTAVAGCLSDRDKDHRPRENCTEAGFSDIPAGLGVTTRVLLFPRNLFTSLSWSSFQTFTEIYEIDLTGNKVPEVMPGGAPILPSLSVLRLGSNQLKSLSDGSFSACPALTELYLENNAITSLTDHAFSGLSLLEILDLSSNHISVLPKLMLHPLPAIETLYVENNKIKVMPDDWFSKKEEVPYLYLSANPWACNCSLDYLHRYLNDYELNVYVRDGPIISSDIESVVCDSPQYHKGKAVVSLEESDLCSPSTEWALNTPFYWLTHGVPTETPNIHIPTPRNTFRTTTTTPAITLAARQMSEAVYREVVTWSWYQTFTSLIEWSDHSGGRGDGSLFGSQDVGIHSPFPTVTPSTESLAIVTTTVPTVTPSTSVTGNPTMPAKTGRTQSTSSTIASTTSITTKTTTFFSTKAATMSVHPLVIHEADRGGKIRAVSAAAVFCFWLFAGCLLLCIASAACVAATLVGLVVWYRRVYKPLSAMQARKRAGGNEGQTLLTFNTREENEVLGGGILALYRSVLYVHREGQEAGGKEGEGAAERVLVNLEPTTARGEAIREEEGQREGEERGVYRKTLYRLLSREEEIEGWRDVMEECRISAEGGARKGVRKEGELGGVEVSRKRYSVILREEREEAGGGREELDWVVGGWEVKRGEGIKEEEPRSSWGEWLAHYLPSMPWGVTTPPEDEATL